MIDGGVVMILTGALLMLAQPLGLVVHRRRIRPDDVGSALRSAIPLIQVPIAFQVLASHADAALDADADARCLLIEQRARLIAESQPADRRHKGEHA